MKFAALSTISNVHFKKLPLKYLKLNLTVCVLNHLLTQIEMLLLNTVVDRFKVSGLRSSIGFFTKLNPIFRFKANRSTFLCQRDSSNIFMIIKIFGKGLEEVILRKMPLF